MGTSIVNELAITFSENPLLVLTDIKPTGKSMHVVGLSNPAVFRFEKKTWILIQVTESPEKVADSTSHFRLLRSDDGREFDPTEDHDEIVGAGILEERGIENCRVTEINGIYYLTYSMVSAYGTGVGLMQTRDWKRFDRKGMILPAHRDFTIFEQKIRDRYYALHGPVSPETGGSYLWISESPDTIHWGNHRCLATTRENAFDSSRVGAGCSPIETPQGWLVIYNGTDVNDRRSLGALLLAFNEPWLVIARSDDPLKEPTEKHETSHSEEGLSTSGHLVVGDKLRLYYGEADKVICGAELSIHAVLNSLSKVNV